MTTHGSQETKGKLHYQPVDDHGALQLKLFSCALEAYVFTYLLRCKVGGVWQTRMSSGGAFYVETPAVSRTQTLYVRIITHSHGSARVL